MNDNVISIDSYEPHYVNEVICINCKHRWIATYNCKTPLKDLSCPKCNEAGYVIKTGQRYDEFGYAE